MNEMNIGLAIINGALAVIGLFFALKRLFRGSDEFKVQQPIKVQPTDRFVTQSECQTSHLTIVQRVVKLEERTDRIERKIDEQTVELARSGERRKDELIAAIESSRKEQQRETRLVHERINPILEKIGHIDGQLNAVTASVHTIELRTKL